MVDEPWRGWPQPRGLEGAIPQHTKGSEPTPLWIPLTLPLTQSLNTLGFMNNSGE